MLSKNLNLLYKSSVMEDVILIPDSILKSKDLNHTQIILLCIIMNILATTKKKKNSISDEILGKIMNCDNRTIRRNLKTLKDLWYLEIEVDKNVPKNEDLGQGCPTRDVKWELRKTTRIVCLGQKCPPYIYNIYSLYTNTSSRKEEKNIRKEEREKMLEEFRKDERLVKFMEEADVIRWWEYKQASKKPYKDIKAFITALVKIKNIIKDYGWMPKADRNRRNRFNFAVNEAIEKGWEWLNWYDSMEQVYESSKNDLYPNPKQNE